MEWCGFSNEAAVADAIRAGGVSTGQYMLPHHGYDRNAMQSPELQQKRSMGPVAYVTVGPNGPPPMAVNMIGTFLVSLFISLVVGYIGHWTLRQGIDSGRIWRVIRASALLGYTDGRAAQCDLVSDAEEHDGEEHLRRHRVCGDHRRDLLLVVARSGVVPQQRGR
jgi:hypothetical protein